MRDTPQFYGLFFIADHHEEMANLPARSGLDTYIACAVNCARSFAEFGYRYTVLSNAPEYIEHRARTLGLETPPLARMHFSMQVPERLGFASAHRKLEVFEQFASGEWGESCVLVDLDTELIRCFPEGLFSRPDAIMALDLTPVMLAEFGPRLASTLVSILGEPVDKPRWWGGEFVSSNREGYGAISRIVSECWQSYLAQADNSIHQGDEALTSAALTRLEAEGWPVADAGAEGAVARWWSARTLVPMPRFREVSGASLLHLPADKPFLAQRARTKPKPERFEADYRAAMIRKLPVRRLANTADRLFGRRPLRFAPRF